MWYQNESELDMSKPIICESDDDNKYICLLTPQLASLNDDNRDGSNQYKIIGYNWLNLRTGKYNSCCFFKTPEEAIKSREDYKIRNLDFSDI